MGYCTLHTIEFATTEAIKDIEASFEQVTRHDYGTLTTEEVKWYDCDKDMVTISKLHPNTLFTVEGDGEDSDDFWKSWYYRGNGQRTVGAIQFPAPNYNNLGDPQKHSPELLI